MRVFLTAILLVLIMSPAAFAQPQAEQAFPPMPEPAPGPRPPEPASDLKPEDIIDYNVLSNNSAALTGLHRARTVDLDTFLEMIADEDTVLLDVRNAWEYQCAHVEGALNMSVADITEESMKLVAPDRQTRIVIYCSDSLFFMPTRRIALTSMAFPVLYELGYQNVYQLQYGYVSGKEELARLPMVTTGPGPEDRPGRYHCDSIRGNLGMKPIVPPQADSQTETQHDTPEEPPQSARP